MNTIYQRPEETVFAEAAKSGEVSPFPDIERGWGITFEQTEGKPPMEWFNDLFKRQFQAIRYFMQRGIAEWSQTEPYPKDALVQYQGKFYQAVGEHRGKLPNEENSQYWKPFGDIDRHLAAVNPHPQYLNKSNLIGVPIPYPSAALPGGYVAMMGQAINAKEAPVLARLYGECLPDLRGEFIRGWDNGRNMDSNRGLLSFQPGSSILGTPIYSSAGFINNAPENAKLLSTTSGQAGSSGISATGVGRYEMHPRNVSFNYICLVG